ncbi:STY4199 family HEPN domain-containing protein [Superficieibacter sp. 1612_C1]|uniref:STY4199 family HEPN domain-containing protein n=1 Tax=Superficieibacter sp. 1612_C1 TaxID=2780382 RepID=UPI001883699A|nr:STY4199 family HEPN domain-containing protein [Superficieibacter sp. 1612_C1]
MVTSTAHQIREQFEHCLAIIRQASLEILLLLNVKVTEGKDPRWFLDQLDQARLSLGGWASVAQRLNLNDAQMSRFTLHLRHLQQWVPQYERGQEVSHHQLIVALRFVTELEYLRQKQPLLKFSAPEEADTRAQQQAQEQLRTLELTLKALIAQAWPDPVRLNNQLKIQFGADKVRRWLKLGERHDVLSGMRFSELALMLVDKKEFARHYAPLFNDPSTLSLFVEPRATLQHFLEDCRQIRNRVIAGEPLSLAQRALLDHYSQQIIAPVQQAFALNKTRVNPAAFISRQESELEDFWESARKKDQLSGGDNTEISDSIERPEPRRKRSAQERDRLISVMLWALVGITVLGMCGGGLWMINQSSATPQASAQSGGSGVKVEREPASPREQLTNMGITWDASNLRSAIDRNDAQVTQLFLRGGMNWKLSWTEAAHAAGNDKVLTLLLRYRLQMDERRPCRRFMTTVGSAMAQGGALTSMRKEYLQAFCTAPLVVERQRYDTEQAKRRAKAQPDAQNKKWLAIQTAIYNEVH